MKTLIQIYEKSILDDIDKQLDAVKPYDAACIAIERFFKENYEKYATYTVKKKPDADGKWIVTVKDKFGSFILNTNAESLTNGLFKIDKCCKLKIYDNPNIKDLVGAPIISGRIEIVNCRNLISIDGCSTEFKIGYGMSGTSMILKNCPKLENIDGLKADWAPDEVFLENLPNLKTFGDCSSRFEYVGITACDNLSNIGSMKRAYRIFIDDCSYKSLSSIKGLSGVSCDRMTVIDCPSMIDVEGLPKEIGDLCLHRDRMVGLNSSYPDISEFRRAIRKESSVGNLDIN